MVRQTIRSVRFNKIKKTLLNSIRSRRWHMIGNSFRQNEELLTRIYDNDSMMERKHVEEEGQEYVI